MTIKPQTTKTKLTRIIEHSLLCICLLVIALRATFTEGITSQAISLSPAAEQGIFSLTVSILMIFLLIFWIVYSIWQKNFTCRLTAIEIGLSIFTIAAVISSIASADKRAAVTDSIRLLAPILMALLLVQLLDTRWKIKLLLVVIVALGAASAWRCTDQYFSENDIMIELYQQDPARLLSRFNITPYSFQHMLLEHRIFSKDVRGFFTTSNSAGSFALLASFAVAGLFYQKLRFLESIETRTKELFWFALAAAIVIYSLIITQSKGAILSAIIAGLIFVIAFRFGEKLKKHTPAIFLTILILALAFASAVVFYGIKFNTLPGSNSMLVRWQYWTATAKMIAGNSLQGVGPGNFASYYTHYKPDSALEAVADPHNFLLTILSQYGILGLIGFLSAILIPLLKIIAAPAKNLCTTIDKSPNRKCALTYIALICLGLLIIRPLLMPSPGAIDNLSEIIYVFFTLYGAPVVAFGICCWFVSSTFAPATDQPKADRIIIKALFCAIIALLLHNLIDYAIFEPGVYTAFWAITASLIALNALHTNAKIKTFTPSASSRIIVTLVAAITCTLFIAYAYVPVYRTTTRINKAMRAFRNGRPQKASSLLTAAAAIDPLDPSPLSIKGRLHLQQFFSTSKKDKNFLIEAEQSLLNAIDRNKADFKNYERLAEAYTLHADLTKNQARTDLLNKAAAAADNAISRYPGSARLRIQAARIAERRDFKDAALVLYKKAVEIENAYRSQFEIMYPDKVIFSRLAEDEYNHALEKIEALSKQAP